MAGNRLFEQFGGIPGDSGLKTVDAMITVVCGRCGRTIPGGVDSGHPCDEDYPGQNDEIRRERLIRKAIETADRVLTDGADGSVEELDYLTAAVAERWAEKVLSAAMAKLLRKDLDLEGRQIIPKNQHTEDQLLISQFMSAAGATDEFSEPKDAIAEMKRLRLEVLPSYEKQIAELKQRLGEA